MDVSSKNPGFASAGSFELDLSVFFGYFLDSRLRRSPFGPASPFAPLAAQCAKESNSRPSAKKVPCLTRAPSVANIGSTEKLHAGRSQARQGTQAKRSARHRAFRRSHKSRSRSKPSIRYRQTDQGRRPGGDAQDVRRFSMRQDASSKNPGFASERRFELDLRCFLDSRLCRSSFGSASPFTPIAVQCPKKLTRAPARKRCQALPKSHPSQTSAAPQTLTANADQRAAFDPCGRIPATRFAPHLKNREFANHC